MASSYDSRYHSSRRYDQYYPASRDHDRHSSLNTPSEYSYDPRYFSSSAAKPQLPRRSADPSPRSKSRRQQQWPPSPSVEDEAAALAKEFRPAGSDKEEASGEVKSRGTIDQQPIIEDIEHNYDRRFVLVSDPIVADATISTPGKDSLKDSRRRSVAERGNMPQLKTEFSDQHLFTPRTPSPYAYSKPSRESTLSSSGAEYFLSPEPITPNASSVPRSIPKPDSYESRREKPSRPAHNRYDSVQHSPRTTKNDAFEDSDLDEEDTSRLRTERTPARYSFVKSDLSREDLRTSLHDTKDSKRSSQPPLQSSSPKSLYENSFSGSSGSSKNSTPPPRSPRTSSSSLENGAQTKKSSSHRPSAADTSYSSRGASSYYSDHRPTSPSRTSSPRTRDSYSPPRSPKVPPSRGKDSPVSSRPSSRGDTRQSSPSPLSYSSTLPPSSASTRVPVTGSDWHSTYPSTVRDTDRPRPSSRYPYDDPSLSAPPPRIDVQSPSPVRQPKPSSSLPYPVDDTPIEMYMPTEESFQYQHSPIAVPPSPSSRRKPYPDDSTGIPTSPVANSPRDRSSSRRPTLSNRHTAAEEVPRSPRIRSNSVRSQSHDGRRNDREAKPLSMNRPLPQCPRSQPTDKYNDWYTLDGCPDIDICPSCFDGVFADTPFTKFFRQSRLYERPEIRYCDFSSPWMRLAWLMTIKQQRKKPDLLYNLATSIEREELCPGDKERAGLWYGVPDPRDERHVAGFTICPCDFKQIEAIFPYLRGYFTPISSTDPRFGRLNTCSLRLSSRRFPKYLDLLVEIDNESRERDRMPEIRPFVELARENAYKMECTRDKLKSRKPWHFIEGLPEFTVCEECYDDVVWPSIESGSKLAGSFNRSLQLVPGEDSQGTSCCLYSPRMRRMWKRAVEDEDFAYLKRKARERKKDELRMHRDKAGLLALLSSREQHPDVDPERVKRILRDVDEQWKEVE